MIIRMGKVKETGKYYREQVNIIILREHLHTFVQSFPRKTQPKERLARAWRKSRRRNIFALQPETLYFSCGFIFSFPHTEDRVYSKRTHRRSVQILSFSDLNMNRIERNSVMYYKFRRGISGVDPNTGVHLNKL